MLVELSLKQQIADLSLACLSVFLFYLAFPSGGYGHAAWFVMVPLLLAINHRPKGYVFLLSLIAATFGWMVSVFWLVGSLAEITSTPFNIIIPLVFICCLLFALPYAIACWLHCYFRFSTSVVGAFSSAIIFTCLINYLPQILPGNLAHALYQETRFIQLADIGGVPLVFFIIHAVNLLLANGILLCKKKPLQSLQCFAFAVFIFMANQFYGEHQLEKYHAKPEEGIITAALIQPNITVDNRTREDWLRASVNVARMINDINQKQHVDVFLMPELPVPISYQYFAEDAEIFNAAIENKALMLTSIEPIGDELSNDAGFYNTIEFIEQQQVTRTYRKQVLLPFAEYLPFVDYFPWLKQLFPYAPNYFSGDKNILLKFKNKQDNLNVVPLICYESVFSDFVAKGVGLGGEVLLNSVNDGWFVNTAGVKIHLALSLFRSIEYRRPLIRVTNTGQSALITAGGQMSPNSIIQENTQSYAVVNLSHTAELSFYQQYPQAFKYFCWFISAVIVFRRRNRARD